MSWIIRGIEHTPTDGPRRHGHVAWAEGRLTGSYWALARLRALDGGHVLMSPVGPAIDVDLRDPASTFWAAITGFWRFTCEGDEVPEVWHDDVPAGVPSAPQSPASVASG